MENSTLRSEIEPFGKLDVIAKQVVQGFITGLHKSPFHGFSVEFAEHRIYNNGESTKHIDWKLFGRSDKLFIKQYEEETNLRCRFLIDTSASMYYPELKKGVFNKIKFSAYAVAAITEILKKQRDAFGVSFFANNLNYHSEIKATTAHQSFVFTQLEELLAQEQIENKESNIIAALHQLAEQIHKRSLVFIFSDCIGIDGSDSQFFDALQHLKHNKHEVVLFHVLDKKTELNFEFGNLPVTFIDVETGQTIKANPNQLRKNYQERMDEFTKQLNIHCGTYKIDLVEVDVNEGFNKVLMNYLRKRQKMI